MNPVQLIIDDRLQARENSDPNADVCFLATADDLGRSHVRTLVLREIVENRFGIYLNKASAKWVQLSQNSHYQFLLFYPMVQRQYRLSGSFKDLPRSTVRDNWNFKPAGSKYLDYYYTEKAQQGSKLDNRQQLTHAISELKQKYPDTDSMSAPDHAIGIELVVDFIDRLDLSNIERIHDRRTYKLSTEGWTEQILVP